MTAAMLPRPRQFWQIVPHAGDHHPALRLAVSSLVPMVALTLAGRPQWGAWAMLACMAAVYGRRESIRRRLLVQATAGLLLTGLVVAGTALAAAAPSGAVIVLCTALVAGAATVLADVGRWSPPGALFPVLVFGAASARPATTGDITLAAGIALAALAWTLAVTAAVRIPGAPPQQAETPAADTRLTVMHAVVCVVAAGLAGAVALLAGWTHPAWAMVAAVVPVVGRSTTGQLLRAGHRLLGTLAGVLVAGAIYSFPYGPLADALILGALLFGAELLIARNYALALLFVTPVTIGMAHPDGGAALRALMLDRALENAAGVAVVVLLILATHRLRHPRVAS